MVSDYPPASTELDLSGQQLSDLSPLRDLTGLQALDISDTQVSDLSPLRDLTGLKTLSIGGTQVSDLSPLRDLTGVTGLYIGGTLVSDLSPLRDLTGLKELSIGGTRVSDLSPLRDLTGLQWLNIQETQVSDLSPLRDLTGLGGLVITKTAVSDLSPLRGLTGLRSLHIDITQVSDLSPLRDLTGLQWLDMSNLYVSDLSPLRDLTGLQWLDISYTDVSDLSALRDLTSLQVLRITETYVSDLSPLRELTGLHALTLWRTPVSDLSPLRDLTGLTELSILEMQVSDLSPLRDLTGLQELRIVAPVPLWMAPLSTALSDVSPLRHLTGLRSLSIVGMQVSDLAPLRELTGLQELNISNMQVSDLSPLRDLTLLQKLHLWRTQVSDLSPLRGLTRLQELNISATQVSDLSPLRGLTRLQELNISATQVSDLSPLRDLTHLQKLDISDTQVSDLSPLEELLVSGVLQRFAASPGSLRMQPPELARASDPAAAFRSYFQDLRRGTQQNTNFKLVLVGNAQVGKTTLKHSLLHGRAPREPIRERTHGIDATTLIWTAGGENLRVTMWDLAGQEIYHTMHRFLLHPRALFLLLWAEETDEKDGRELHSVSYWLELVRQLGPGGITILVKNQIDRSNRFGTRPPELAGAEIPIAAEAAVSAASGRGMAALRETVSEQILRFRDMWGYALPTSWLGVQAEVEERREAGAREFPFGQFEQICAVHDARHPRVLAEYLDLSGLLFYRSGHFGDRLILDYDWLLEQVYAVFDSGRRIRDRISRMGGVIRFDDTEWVWPGHDEDERKVFLGFLTSTALAFKVRSEEPAEYVIPALLPTAKPKLGLSTRKGDLWLELRYRVLHRAVIERLIAHLSVLSPERQWWCDGIEILAPDVSWGASVEVKPDGRTLTVGVHVLQDGQADELRVGVAASLLELIQQALPGAEAAIAGSLDGKIYVDLDKLERARAEGRTHCVDSDGNPCQTAEFAGVPSRTDLARSNRHSLNLENRPVASETRKLKIFISYAHKDEKLKEALEERLKSIGRQYSIEAWSDRQIFAGALVHDEILARLKAADMTLLLISPSFMASDYCWTREMELALEQYEREGKVPVPIIVRETPGWHESKIGLHLALPKDGRPRSAWRNADAFWSAVEEGLRRLIQDQLGEAA